MNYIGIIQVKYASEAFPGKSLTSIGKESALEFLLKRLKGAGFLSRLIIATTSDSSDDQVADLGKAHGIETHRGDPLDVLGRIYDAVKKYAPYGVVKFLGNAPLVDLDAVKSMITAHYNHGYDYAYNEHHHGVMFGMGASVFTFKIIETLAHSTDLSMDQRAIGSLYIRQHARKFKILVQPSHDSSPHFRVLIDTAKDAELVKTIIKYVPEITNSSVGSFLREHPLLVEYQKGSGVSETGLDKLFLFPDKMRTYLNGSRDNSFPVSVEVSLTNRCNFKCEWCSDQNLRNRLGGEFTVETMERLFHDLKAGGTRGIVIEGGGEPMIHPQFDDIVKKAAAIGLSLGLITNGSVKLKRELIPLFEWVRVSLDSATPDQHLAAKKVDMFERVMKHIRHIGENKTKTTLGVGYVVTNANVDNLENLILRLKLYNVNYIQFRPVIDNPKLASLEDLSYLKKFESDTFKVDIQAMTSNKETGNGGKSCLANSLSAVVTADGSVFLCGRLNIYEWVKPIGNIHQQSFKDIWLGEERARQAGEVAEGEFCAQHCPECRMTKYNLLINRVRVIQTKNFI